MRSDLEKIISFIFLNLFKEYFELIEKENEESTIRLSVLEILVNYLNILIREYDFLYLIYLNYDFSKIRNNLLLDLLRFTQKYFLLKGVCYSYLKTSITYLYLNIFDILYKVFVEGKIYNNNNYLNYDFNKIEVDYNFIKEIETIQDFWKDEVFPMINLESSNFKKFNNKVVPLFGLNPIATVHKKKGKIEIEIEKEKEELITKLNPFNESKKDQENIGDNINPHLDQKENKKIKIHPKSNYRKIAYTIAILVKYSSFVDVNKLFEIFGNKNEFSEMIIREYLNTFDFRNLDILKAYRIFISTFKLTGESDTIYNIIIGFSEKYFNDNLKDENLRSINTCLFHFDA
jgi:hypothetical protein